jgi:hypothetical protein
VFTFARVLNTHDTVIELHSPVFIRWSLPIHMTIVDAVRALYTHVQPYIPVSSDKHVDVHAVQPAFAINCEHDITVHFDVPDNHR